MAEILSARALILRQHIGTATASDGTVFELATSMGGSPIVKNETTGLSYSLSWQDILEMAAAAGINKEAA